MLAVASVQQKWKMRRIRISSGTIDDVKNALAKLAKLTNLANRKRNFVNFVKFVMQKNDMRNVRKVRILRFLTFLSTDFNIPAYNAEQWKKKEIDHKILKKFSFTCTYQKFYVILERNSEIA